MLSVLPATAQEAAVDTTATMKRSDIGYVTVTTRRASVRSLAGAINGKDILRDELSRLLAVILVRALSTMLQ